MQRDTGETSARSKIAAAAFFFVVILDQLAKYFILNIKEYLPFCVVPGFFDIVYVANTGGAFGILKSSGSVVITIVSLSALAVMAVFFILRVVSSECVKTEAAGFGLVFGGAISNMYDRIIRKAVVDFLDIYAGNWHWPAFNLADMAICMGVVFICIRFFSNSET